MEESSNAIKSPPSSLPGAHTSMKTIDSAPQPTASKKRTSSKSGKKGRSKGKTNRSKTVAAKEIEEEDLQEEEQEEEDLLAPVIDLNMFLTIIVGGSNITSYTQ
jgi:hypothetical protein